MPMNTQIRSLSHHRRLLDGRSAFAARILATGPIAYWPLWETAGATAECLVNSAQNGTYTGVTLNNTLGPDGLTSAPFFDGTNDYVNIYTATFEAAFDGAVGSYLIWMKVADAGVWTDGLNHFPINIEDSNLNLHKLQKLTANNQILCQSKAGGTAGTITKIGATETGWTAIGSTWSDEANADEFIGYYNGAAIGAPSAGLGTWSGDGLTTTAVLIGAQTNTPIAPWHGWLAHGAVWDRVLTPAEMADLATV